MDAESWGKLKKLMLEECIDNYGSCADIKQEYKIPHLGTHLDNMEQRIKSK